MGIDEVRARIAEAARAAGRAEEDVRLVAVSKLQPDERVRSALSAGLRCFGENRVQEAAGKWPTFREEFDDVDLHLVGPLQSNKARQAVELFDTIQTLDRPKLAKALARLAQERGACPQLFIQVNTGEEEQKAGVLPNDADDFVRACRDMDLPVAGLMTIPPIDEDPEPHFRMLRDMVARNGLQATSMGMSADFEQAIAAGATHIRVGSALFGPRKSG